MRKYDFEHMGALWADHARQIVEQGVFVANEGSWDMWAHNGTIYSLPVAGSGGSPSFWCAISHLRAHLYHLRAVCGYAELIPPDWENANVQFLSVLGIK